MNDFFKTEPKKEWAMRAKLEYALTPKRGLDQKTVELISAQKKEPQWMLDFRLKALTEFIKKPLPKWGPDLKELDFTQLFYYLKPKTNKIESWADLPKDIKQTYDYLGIPKVEQNILAGVSAQFESEVLYKSIKASLTKKGVIFLDTDSALKAYPKLFKEYFGKLIPAQDNKFAALNSAVWSGGSFLYIPKGVKIELPLQAYFRINAESAGQFERTLIIAEEGSSVHYIEGCSAPIYSSASLHAAVVEIFVKANAKVRYTTIQNWSPNVYNLVTKRATVKENGVMQWIDGNLGSKVTMKYPACFLTGKGARGEMLSLAFAGRGQIQDTGAKMYHLAPNTSSRIVAKSLVKNGGLAIYRGLNYIQEKAINSKTKITCDTLILDEESSSHTYPTMKIKEKRTKVEHEATVSKLDEEQILYLQSRGVEKSRAESLIVNGFLEDIVRELPLEYAVEINRLIMLSMEGSNG